MLRLILYASVITSVGDNKMEATLYSKQTIWYENDNLSFLNLSVPWKIQFWLLNKLQASFCLAYSFNIQS